LVEDVADGVDGGVQASRRVARCELLFPDELVQPGDVYQLRVGAGKVKAVE
jgi:hypothetical protein